MQCTPEYPLRPADEASQLQAALETLRQCDGSAASLLAAYSLPGEDLSLAALKQYLKKDHKGPIRHATRAAVIRAGQRAWARRCAQAALHDQLAAALVGGATGSVGRVDPFYGRYRSVDRKRGEPWQVANRPVVMGPCKHCRRALFQVDGEKGRRCGFVFNMATRLYILVPGKNYLRMAIVRSPDNPAIDPLVGILLGEETDVGANVVACKLALIPEQSGWYQHPELQKKMSKLLVNEKAADVPDGMLFGWKSLPRM
jgi:hypothetical protein